MRNCQLDPDPSTDTEFAALYLWSRHLQDVYPDDAVIYAAVTALRMLGRGIVNWELTAIMAIREIRKSYPEYPIPVDPDEVLHGKRT